MKRPVNNRLIKNAVKISALALTVSIFATGALGSRYFGVVKTDAATSISGLEAQIQKNNEQLDALEDKIESLKNKESSVIDLKTELDSEINVLQKNIDATNDLINEYNISIDNKIGEIEEKELELNDRYAKFKQYLRASYEDGQYNYIGMIFSSSDFTDLLTRMERIGNLMEYEQTLIEELNRETEDLRAMKNSLESERSRNQELKASLQSSQAALDKKLDNAIATIKQLENDTSAAESERQKIIAANKKLDSELTAMLAELQKQSQSNYVGGSFRWPVDLSNKTISSYYGQRELWGMQDFHLGIDIPAPYGSNVYAANGGTVLKAEWHFSYGYYVVIDHGGGMSTLYAHNSSLKVKAGDTVKAGSVIALVGSTGSSSGNHCHFEVRKNGATQNPLNGYVVKP